MDELEVCTEYISTGCSRTPQALDWGAEGRICYCSGSALLLAAPGAGDTLQVEHSAHSHTGDVITCRWITHQTQHLSTLTGDCGSAETSLYPLIITGSRDHTAAVWRCGRGAPPRALCALRGHSRPVELADGVLWREQRSQQLQLLCVTAAADGCLCLWRCDGREVTAETPQIALHQTVALNGRLALSLRLLMPTSAAQPWLAYGADDNAVVVMTADAAGVYAASLRLQGHSDWVRCMDAVSVRRGHLLLATGAQDALVRVWRVSDDAEADADRTGTEPEAAEQLRLRSLSLTALSAGGRRRRYTVTLDSVLSGHEGWVCGLRWRPSGGGGGAPQLCSASMDRTLLVWSPAEGVYVETARLGAVGGNTLGLLGCAWRPDGGAVIAHGHGGAVHVWYSDAADAANAADRGRAGDAPDAPDAAPPPPERWRPGAPFGGHSSSVCDLAWSPGGGYLLTCGADQTTRLHARVASTAAAAAGQRGAWHQLGRPQVHGHDMTCLAAVTDAVFASGSEEKVVRTFGMPTAVRDTLLSLCGDKAVADAGVAAAAAPEGAAVPSLGLTNKPVFAGDAQTTVSASRDAAAEAYFQRPDQHTIPTEETLQQNALWPELRKLYGHGYEVTALAAAHDGRLLASACRAARPEHAALLLWDSASWRQLQQLAGAHQLTVVQLAFSPDDGWLLAASRDRTWSLWRRAAAADGADASEPPPTVRYTLAQRGVKAHSRIIWTCAWLPDSAAFVTGSRDGSLLLWRRSGGVDADAWAAAGAGYRPGAAVTAAAVDADAALVAVGLETGVIKLVTLSADHRWTEKRTLDTSAAHHGAVRRLQFRPRPVDGSGGDVLLASCATDGAVKLHRIVCR